MRPVFTAQRRADEFAALIEGARPLDAQEQARFGELLELVGSLRSVPTPEPRPEFAADLRARLMAEADSLLLPLDTTSEARLRLGPQDPRRARRDRRVATLLGGAALIGATTSVAVAAQTALPGDTLYPVKRALENAEAGVAVGDDDKGGVLMASATQRLDEVSELVDRDTPEGRAAMPGTITTFTEQADEASTLLLDDFRTTGREGSITELREFTRASMERLGELAGVLPADAHDELVAAADRLLEIDEEARLLCPSCAGSGITELPPILASGAVLSGTTLPTDWATLPGLPELPDLEGATDLNNRTAGDGSGSEESGGTGTGTGPLPVPGPTGLPGPLPGGGETTDSTVDKLKDTLLGGVTTSATPTANVLEGTGELLDDTVDDVGGVVEDTTGGLGGLIP